MERKKSAGFILTILTAVISAAALVCYFVNTGTRYFKNMGINPVVIICLIAAIAAEVSVLVVGMKKQPLWADILPIVASVTLMVGMLNFISARVNGIAAIMTFENNAQNMSDLKSAIVGIVACLIALILAIVTSFFDVTEEK